MSPTHIGWHRAHTLPTRPLVKPGDDEDDVAAVSSGSSSKDPSSEDEEEKKEHETASEQNYNTKKGHKRISIGKLQGSESSDDVSLEEKKETFKKALRLERRLTLERLSSASASEEEKKHSDGSFPVTPRQKHLDEKPQNIRIQLRPFYFDLPEGQRFVKNKMEREFWDIYNDPNEASSDGSGTD